LHAQAPYGIRKQVKIRIDKNKPYQNLPFRTDGYYVGYSLTYLDSNSITKYHTKIIYKGEKPYLFASKSYREKFTDTINTYVPKAPDTTYWIHVFYPSGFIVSFWLIEKNIGNYSSTFSRKSLLDTQLVNSFFRSINLNSKTQKLYRQSFDRGVYRITGDTLHEVSLVHGNDMFSNWNAGEGFYKIMNDTTLLELGGRYIGEKGIKIKWDAKAYQTTYQFVHCDILPPDEGWLQSLNWIYK